MIVIFSVLVVFVIGLLFGAIMPLPNWEKKMERKIKISMKKHLEIPLSFWDDYNHAYRRIQSMNTKTIDKCEGMIDDLIYKYAELMDIKTFWEKIETITLYFEMRKDLLLNK